MKRVTLGRFAFQYRTRAEWEQSQLILYAGELAVEGDTGLMKVGDGRRLYAELPYFNRGPEGKRGKQGDRGETGAALNVKGTKDAASELPATGAAGDAYMVGGDLYVWSDTTWTNVGRIKGEKGDRGEQGPAGPTGPQGATGAKGEKGDQGDQGPRGFTGEQGANGIQGPRGETGPRGEKGDKGEKGDALRWKDLTEAQKKELAPDLTPYVTEEKHKENLSYVMNEVNNAKKFFEEQTSAIDTALAQVVQDIDNEKLNKSDVINDLTTGGTDKAISAEAAKSLDEKLEQTKQKAEKMETDINGIGALVKKLQPEVKIVDGFTYAKIGELVMVSGSKSGQFTNGDKIATMPYRALNPIIVVTTFPGGDERSPRENVLCFVREKERDIIYYGPEDIKGSQYLNFWFTTDSAYA